MKNIAVLIMSAGQSRRFGDSSQKKTFALLQNRPVWQYSLELFQRSEEVGQIILVIDPADRELFENSGVALDGVEITGGGKERFNSVENGLQHVRPEMEYIAVHDAARPCVSFGQIEEVFRAARKTGAAILATPITGTIKRARPDGDGFTIEETVARENLWEAQTPQVFRRDLLIEAYNKRENVNATDDAHLVQQLGHPITIILGDRTNLKITTRPDLELAEQILQRRKR